MTAVLPNPPTATQGQPDSTDWGFRSGVRSVVGSLVRSVVGFGPDDPHTRKARALPAIPYSLAAPDKVDETRTMAAGRAGHAVGAAGAAPASGLIEGDLTVALDREWRRRPGTRAVRAVFDLRCGRIDGCMDDPETGVPDEEEVRR